MISTKPLRVQDDKRAFYMNVFLTFSLGILSLPYVLIGFSQLVGRLFLLPIDFKIFSGKWNVDIMEAVDAIGLKDEIELQNSDARHGSYTVEEEQMLMHLYLHAQ